MKSTIRNWSSIRNPQTKILQAVGASNFTSANLESSLLKSQAQSAAKFLALGILRPAEMFQEATARFKDFLTQLKTQGPLAGPIAYVSTQLGTLCRLTVVARSRAHAAEHFANTIPTPLSRKSRQPSVQPSRCRPIVPMKNLSDSASMQVISAVAFHRPVVSGLNLGPDAALSATGAFAFTGNLNFSGILGIDLTQAMSGANRCSFAISKSNLGRHRRDQQLECRHHFGWRYRWSRSGNFALNTSVDVDLHNPTGGTQVTLDDVLDGCRYVGTCNAYAHCIARLATAVESDFERDKL